MRSEKHLVHTLSALVLVALVGLTLATFLDYGMTADEPVQNRYGHRLLRWYGTRGADRSAVEQHDTYYYGGLFELAAQAAILRSPFGPYETRHLTNAFFAFVGYLAAWWMGAQLGGALGGLLSTIFLALTPAFYGHAFNNPKDAPFAALFGLGAAAVLRVARELPRPGWPGVLGAGVAVGLAAAVRVAGLTLVGAAAVLWTASLLLDGPARAGSERSRGRELARLVVLVGAVLAVAWLVMLAFWPWAQLDPLRNPFRAWRVFSRFWETMPVLYDGELQLSGDVSRFYVPKWFALTLPESYLVAAVMGLSALGAVLRSRPPGRDLTTRFMGAAWLALLTAGPVFWAVANHTPFYNGHRHFLFVVPGLAVLAGTAGAGFFRGPFRPAVKALGGLALGATFVVTLVDMIQLHPYQSVYFNRLVAGGLRSAWTRYETDYWCATYREGLDWVVGHYSRPGRRERVRVAGHATLVQVDYNLRRSDARRRAFQAVTVHDDPHVVLATTATRDHERTEGRVVHVLERQGAPLLYVFERRKPQ